MPAQLVARCAGDRPDLCCDKISQLDINYRIIVLLQAEWEPVLVSGLGETCGTESVGQSV